MRNYLLLAAFALTGTTISAPVAARVHEQTQDGFVSRHVAIVPAGAEETWDMLVRPAQWWDDASSFSGDAANLSLHPRAGGCFCEVLPGKSSPRAAPRGSVEHMRVVYAEDARALRMVGALGPMQSDAVTGVLTIVLRPSATGTQILWEYAVSGNLRKPGVAAAIDQMLAGQILRLAGKLGGAQEPSGPAGEGPWLDYDAPTDGPEPRNVPGEDRPGAPGDENRADPPPAKQDPQPPIIGR
jgi:hypothetical protein